MIIIIITLWSERSGARCSVPEKYSLFLLFAPEPAFGATQPPIQYIVGDFSSMVKVDNFSPYSDEVGQKVVL